MAPRITGWLHTQGGQILDEKEQPVRFEGMNLGAPLVNGFGYPLVDDSACTTWWDGYDKIVRHGYDNISRWGFNLVRAQFSWADLEPFPPTINQDGSITHHWNQYYLKAMDNIVSNLTSRGIALIPDIGQFYWSPAFKHPYTSGYCQGGGMPVWLYPNAASLQKTPTGGVPQAECDFLANIPEPGVSVKPLDSFIQLWQFIASRYASNSLVVGAGILNELYFLPYTGVSCEKLNGFQSDYSLRTFYVRVGEAISSVNPNLLLVFEGGPSDLGEFTNLQGPFPRNAIYSFHFYPRSWNETLFNFQLSFARKWNVPAWIGEFNFKLPTSGTPDPNWQGNTMKLLSAAKHEGLGWNYWALDDQEGITWWHPPAGPRTDLETVSLVQSGFSSGFYNAVFAESGLPTGTPWRVNLSGWTKTSNLSVITFPVLNGTYRYDAASDGFARSAGIIVVSGSNINQLAEFSAVVSTSTSSTSSLPASTTSTSSGPSPMSSTSSSSSTPSNLSQESSVGSTHTGSTSPFWNTQQLEFAAIGAASVIVVVIVLASKRRQARD